PSLEVLEDRSLPSTLTVTNLGDTGVAGDGSLRGEVAAALPGDTIVFAQGQHGSIRLGSPLTLSQSVTIQGNLDSSNTPLITLDGHGQVQDLLVNRGVTANLSNLVIANGFTSLVGGAGVSNQGNLRLDHVWVLNNTARPGGADIVR